MHVNLQDRIVRRQPRPGSPVPILRGSPTASRSSTSACRPCARASCRRGSSTRWSRSTRCTSRLRAVLARAARGVRAPEDIFTEYAYFSSYSDSWVAHAATTSEMTIERFGLGPRQPRGGARAATTATCSSTSSRAGIPVARRRAGRERGRGGARAGHPDARRVLRPRAGRASSCGGTAGRPVVGQQRPGAGARPQRLRRRHRRSCSRPRAWSRRVPAPARLVEGNQFDTIYHEHFSYFSFLTASGLRRPTA